MEETPTYAPRGGRLPADWMGVWAACLPSQQSASWVGSIRQRPDPGEHRLLVLSALWCFYLGKYAR